MVDLLYCTYNIIHHAIHNWLKVFNHLNMFGVEEGCPSKSLLECFLAKVYTTDILVLLFSSDFWINCDVELCDSAATADRAEG